ncbi:hypothetical protein NLI96_g7363 [Meripilus lineatus]|uniref:Alpha-N-acetylglucosaminidase n=1 Tax=Meripilus lineatus TaxID=2056292 RepID=A0AAD5V4J9_9APHY|nr:hypothetical protein NLI96_g7363 [Physisporinus lineatus]
MLIHLFIVWTICIGFVRSTDICGLSSLIHRRLPSIHHSSFTFHLINGEGDAFNVTDTSILGGITVSCTTTSACARGLYTYLTQRAGVDIWWTGSRLDNLPLFLPRVGRTLSGKAIVPYRYYFNQVTFAYTTAFWSFDQWELLLDWLALRGVNLPLAWVGYEHILSEVLREVGLSDDEIYSFLSGPAFLPWNRFGNIQGSWGGRLPARWVEDQFTLQKQIIQRMVELGMTPVLPAFTGFVPPALASHFPDANIAVGSPWVTFPYPTTPVHYIPPSDPLFSTLQKMFISKQKAAFGDISNIYTLDRYNENSPTVTTAELRNISADTFASLRAADPQAIWLMSGWIFSSDRFFWQAENRVQTYLDAIPNDSVIILDFYAEANPQWSVYQNFYGKPWVWCELHDFGGNMGMEGNLQRLTTWPLDALNSSGSSMKGMGLTMEGQEGNEIIYDVVLDQAWSRESLNVSDYGKRWVERRYQNSRLPASVYEAWDILDEVIYNNQNLYTQATIKSILELTPKLDDPMDTNGHHPTFIPYDTNTTIVRSLCRLVQAGVEDRSLLNVPEFNYDLVDISRQLLVNRFVEAWSKLVSTYTSLSTDYNAVAAAAPPLHGIVRDLDTVLATNENFLLANWIRDARSWAGKNETYAAYLEYNARNQITLWGPNGEISDYGSRQWAGLVGDYYLRRWQNFTDYLVETKRDGVKYDSDYVKSRMIIIGQLWDSETFAGPWEVQGKTFEVVQMVLNKYA